MIMSVDVPVTVTVMEVVVVDPYKNQGEWVLLIHLALANFQTLCH